MQPGGGGDYGAVFRNGSNEGRQARCQLSLGLRDERAYWLATRQCCSCVSRDLELRVICHLAARLLRGDVNEKAECRCETGERQPAEEHKSNHRRNLGKIFVSSTLYHKVVCQTRQEVSENVHAMRRSPVDIYRACFTATVLEDR